MSEEYIKCDKGMTVYLVKEIEQLFMSLDPPARRIDAIAASLMVAAMQLSISSPQNEFEEALHNATDFFQHNARRFSEALLRTDGRPN